MEKEIVPLKCPMCGDELIHEELGHEEYADQTHMFSCYTCSFIGFEFYNNLDADRVATRLKQGGEFNSKELADNLIEDTRFEDWAGVIMEDLEKRSMEEELQH